SAWSSWRSPWCALLEVAKHKTIPANHVASFQHKRPIEHRAGASEGMEFAVLAARVDPGGQVGQQFGVEGATDEALGQLARIEAGHVAAEPGLDHVPRQRGRVA